MEIIWRKITEVKFAQAVGGDCAPTQAELRTRLLLADENV